MSKRAPGLKRNPRDYYPTPDAAMSPLLTHMGQGQRFVEPCAGDGRMTAFFERHGHHCVLQSDISPQSPGVRALDAMGLNHGHCRGAEVIVTNPPWDRKILHPMIERFSDILPTWLLFDADWLHTKQAEPFMPRLRKIVSVGRVKWIENSKHTGKDNAAWYLFHKPSAALPVFVGRTS